MLDKYNSLGHDMVPAVAGATREQKQTNTGGKTEYLTYLIRPAKLIASSTCRRRDNLNTKEGELFRLTKMPYEFCLRADLSGRGSPAHNRTRARIITSATTAKIKKGGGSKHGQRRKQEAAEAATAATATADAAGEKSKTFHETE